MIAVVALLLATLVPVTSAAAAGPLPARSVAASGIKPMTLVGFEPGNLISDDVFTDRGTMSEAQIQNFFNSKVSRCLGGIDEHGRPIVCLKDFTITSVNRSADKYCDGYSGAANESAARIIYRVAQSCGINPQVLIVMLQKEQGLVNHVWPSAWRYDIALGQGCPDDAPCDPKYIGFFHQIYGAARQMKIYMEGRYFTWYAPGKTWNILYHDDPARNCGSAPVHIANKATSALYYYTPYQPNAASLRAGYGEGDRCSSYGNRNFYNYFTDWFGSTQGKSNDPIGNVEVVQAQPGRFQVSGWALDPNTSAPIPVHVYVGSAGTAITADIPRTDVGAAYPAAGSNHGFSTSVPAPGPGSANVCIYAINSGPGTNVLLGCRSVNAMSGDPVGGAFTATGSGNQIRVSGWAIDPDTVDPATVHVYVGSAGTAVVANKSRTDIPGGYAAYGASHGYDTAIPAATGSHTVCVYGINSGPGANVLFGCTTVQVQGTVVSEQGRVPIGRIDSVSVSGNVATVNGFALDPDTVSPIKVHLYVGSTGREFTADKPRADVGGAYPAYGDRHGFLESLTLPVGKSSICAYAINTGPGGHSFLGCKEATVTAPASDPGRSPFGNFDAAIVSPGTITVSGWAIDPDTSDAISVHVYVGAAGYAYWADKERTDVGAVYPAYGTRHGFVQPLTVGPGNYSVCVYAINNGAGGHTLLGCRSVSVG